MNHLANHRVCKHPKNTIGPHCIPFPANQVFHVFNLLLIAICMAVVHVLNSLAPRLVSMSSLWLVRYVPYSQLCRLCPTVQGEWRILWTSCRIFAWFTCAFLSSLNNNYHQRAYYRQEVIMSLPILTLYGT